MQSHLNCRPDDLIFQLGSSIELLQITNRLGIRLDPILIHCIRYQLNIYEDSAAARIFLIVELIPYHRLIITVYTCVYQWGGFYYVLRLIDGCTRRILNAYTKLITAVIESVFSTAPARFLTLTLNEFQFTVALSFIYWQL